MRRVTAILFDIDGTLLDMLGVGHLSFTRALEAVFGFHDELDYIQFAGNTDLNVLEQVLSHHGRVLHPSERAQFFQRLPQELAAAAARARLTLHPGVRELLERLSRRPDVVLGLVTGNVEACAWIKLQQFDLQGHFLLGAYGNEHADRNRIATLAMERVQARLAPGETLDAVFLIGDTPNDIRAAHTIGAVAVAVATGRHSQEELRAQGADMVLPTLADTAGILRNLLPEA